MKKRRLSYWYGRFIRLTRAITLERVSNYLLIHLNYIFGTEYIKSLPPLIYIDPLNYCNLHCPLCPTGQGVLGRGKGKMPFDLYKKIIDQVYKKILFINLFNWGEPLLHPEIHKFIRYANEKRIGVRISTNLNKITENQARLLVSAGLEEIYIDIDGATQETYEKYRVGGNIEKVFRGIEYIIQARKLYNSIFPLITIRILENKYNQAEIGEIINKTWYMDIDRIEVASLFVNPERKLDVDKWIIRQSNNKQINQNTRIKCKDLWLNLTISWDGGIFPCCWMHNKEYDFGNINDIGNIFNILNNKEYRSSRLFLSGKLEDISPQIICRTCRGFPENYYYYWDREEEDLGSVKKNNGLI